MKPFPYLAYYTYEYLLGSNKFRRGRRVIIWTHSDSSYRSYNHLMSILNRGEDYEG